MYNYNNYYYFISFFFSGNSYFYLFVKNDVESLCNNMVKAFSVYKIVTAK